MGLLDILNGMQNGPRGPSQPSAESQSAESQSGGMSPLTLAILAVLGYKALKHLTGSQPDTSPATTAPPPPMPGRTVNAGLPGSSGGLGDLLKGGLGGLLAGGAAGSVLSGGLGELLNQLQKKGHSETANSWVGSGPNKQIAPRDLADALGADQINALTTQTGLSRDELLNELSQHLPEVVHHLTPDGRLPTESELSRLL
ncbi:YidB family protein [Nitrobacter sp.]|uniref:YidB family protein n=1 Tax=unclassified Nitrobacter TaxID=2620411 RepID=UPI0032207910